MLRELSVLVLGCVLSAPLAAFAGEDKNKHGDKDKGYDHSHHQSAKEVPPGLAKKGGLPPGLAKKFGRPVPARLYVAFDPRRDDRAWFLIDDRWVLFTNFDPALRLEVRNARALPPIPAPPLPLPVPRLHVVLFG